MGRCKYLHNFDRGPDHYGQDSWVGVFLKGLCRAVLAACEGPTAWLGVMFWLIIIDSLLPFFKTVSAVICIALSVSKFFHLCLNTNTVNVVRKCELIWSLMSKG